MSIPDLWSRARFMLAVLLRDCGSIRYIASRGRIRGQKKKKLVSWIKPLETFTRQLLIVGALTYLMMTDAGRRMRATARKVAIPERRPPVGQSAHPNRLPHPGWRTIAQPPTKADLQRLTGPQCPPPDPVAPPDMADPANWTCPFRVLRWDFPEPDRPPPAPQPKRGSPMIASLAIVYDERRPLDLGRPPSAHREPSLESSAERLARRIETLSRILSNPEPYIRRLALVIARLPRGVLKGRDRIRYVNHARYPHGAEETAHASWQEFAAFRAFEASG